MPQSLSSTLHMSHYISALKIAVLSLFSLSELFSLPFSSLLYETALLTACLLGLRSVCLRSDRMRFNCEAGRIQARLGVSRGLHRLALPLHTGQCLRTRLTCEPTRGAATEWCALANLCCYCCCIYCLRHHIARDSGSLT